MSFVLLTSVRETASPARRRSHEASLVTAGEFKPSTTLRSTRSARNQGRKCAEGSTPGPGEFPGCMTATVSE